MLNGWASLWQVMMMWCACVDNNFILKPELTLPQPQQEGHPVWSHPAMKSGNLCQHSTHKNSVPIFLAWLKYIILLSCQWMDRPSSPGPSRLTNASWCKFDLLYSPVVHHSQFKSNIFVTRHTIPNLDSSGWSSSSRDGPRPHLRKVYLIVVDFSRWVVIVTCHIVSTPDTRYHYLR